MAARLDGRVSLLGPPWRALGLGLLSLAGRQQPGGAQPHQGAGAGSGAQRGEAQARLSELDDRFEKLGMSPSAVEIARMQKNLETHQQLAAQLLEVESALRVLENAENLGREKEDLTRELAVLDERREQERSLRRKGLLSPEDLPEAEEKLRALGERLKAGKRNCWI